MSCRAAWTVTLWRRVLATVGRHNGSGVLGRVCCRGWTKETAGPWRAERSWPGGLICGRLVRIERGPIGVERLARRQRVDPLFKLPLDIRNLVAMHDALRGQPIEIRLDVVELRARGIRIFGSAETLDHRANLAAMDPVLLSTDSVLANAFFGGFVLGHAS